MTTPELLYTYCGYLDTEARDDMRAGTIAAAIYNVNRGKKSRPLSAADIFPHLKERRRG